MDNRLGLGLAVFVSMTTPARAQHLDRDLSAVVESVRRELGAPAAVVGVLRDDGDPMVIASGYADRDARRPIAEDDPFFLGSISKTYTAAVVLRLIEEGVLSLDDPVARWLPTFPQANEITVHHLLKHTSGLKDFYSYIYFRPDRAEMIDLVTRSWRQEDLIALSARFGHWFDPGTEWSYSSTNYFLLGIIIERASGLSLTEAYRKYIYGPLGLRRTWLAWHDPAPSILPTGYLGEVPAWPHSAMFGELGPTTQLDRSPVEWGAGGLAASATEALRFLRGLMAGDLLAPSALAAMTQFRPTPALGVSASDGADEQGVNGYGLGLVRMRRVGLTLWGHGGLFTGHTAGLWYVPACRVTVVLYFNRGFVGQRVALDRLLPAIVNGVDSPGCAIG